MLDHLKSLALISFLLCITLCSTVGCQSQGSTEQITASPSQGGSEEQEFLEKMAEPPPIEEKKRVSNPQKTLDAVVAIKLTNATVATPTEIYVLRSGEEISGDPTFHADLVEDIDINWKDDSNLVVTAKSARIFTESSTYEVQGESGNIKYQVENRRPKDF